MMPAGDNAKAQDTSNEDAKAVKSTNGFKEEEESKEDATKVEEKVEDVDKGLAVTGEEVGKEVLIGGDTEGNRSARGSIRERHQVKTFSEAKEKSPLGKPLGGEIVDPNGEEEEEMGRCLGRVTTSLESSSNMQSVAGLTSLATIIDDPVFRLLVSVHNTIQRVQCFQCPPPALCPDARDLVQECMVALQPSHLPEAAEILDILNKIEFEGLFYSHDKLATLQGGQPWKKCLAEMWSKDKPQEQAPPGSGDQANCNA